MKSRMPNGFRTLALAAVLLTTACGGGDFMAPATAPSDTYTLHSFNGAALPALISADAEGQVSLLDDSFEFHDGGSYLERGHLRTVRNGVETFQTLESPGTYSRDGTRVTLTSSSATITGAFTDSATLTIVAGTNTLVFRR
jgi:hypothetical protein